MQNRGQPVGPRHHRHRMPFVRHSETSHFWEGRTFFNSACRCRLLHRAAQTSSSLSSLRRSPSQASKLGKLKYPFESEQRLSSAKLTRCCPTSWDFTDKDGAPCEPVRGRRTPRSRPRRSTMPWEVPHPKWVSTQGLDRSILRRD